MRRQSTNSGGRRSRSLKSQAVDNGHNDVLCYCKALLDYDGDGDDELSFHVGDVLEVLDKSPNGGVDDGWWLGTRRRDDSIGTFPSMLVHEIDRRDIDN